jgi:DNA-binding FadR family transcriptional regulator
MKGYLTPVGNRGTNLDGIARQLIRLIMEGHFEPGDRLPPEHELAKQLEVGRGSVREALKALSVFGLVTAQRGKEPSLRSALTTSFGLYRWGSGKAAILKRCWKHAERSSR